MDKQQAAKAYGKDVAWSRYTNTNETAIAENATKDWISGWEAREAQSPTDANQADSEIRAALGVLLDEIPPQTQDADWWHDGLTEAISRAEKAYFGIKDTTNPYGSAPQADYKEAIRKMMKESGSDLLTYLPQLSATQRAKAQVIVMDEFFKTFPPGTDLEQLRKAYNEIKPCV